MTVNCCKLSKPQPQLYINPDQYTWNGLEYVRDHIIFPDTSWKNICWREDCKKDHQYQQGPGKDIALLPYKPDGRPIYSDHKTGRFCNMVEDNCKNENGTQQKIPEFLVVVQSCPEKGSHEHHNACQLYIKSRNINLVPGFKPAHNR